MLRWFGGRIWPDLGAFRWVFGCDSVGSAVGSQGLEARGDPAAMGSRVKEDERHERIIRGLLKLPANKRCINCNNLVSPLARISRARLLNVDGVWERGS